MHNGIISQRVRVAWYHDHISDPQDRTGFARQCFRYLPMVIINNSAYSAFPFPLAFTILVLAFSCASRLHTVRETNSVPSYHTPPANLLSVRDKMAHSLASLQFTVRP